MASGSERWGVGVGSLSDAVKEAQDLIDSLVVDGHNLTDGRLGASAGSHRGNGAPANISLSSVEGDGSILSHVNSESAVPPAVRGSETATSLDSSRGPSSRGEGGVGGGGGGGSAGNAQLMEKMQRTHQQRISETCAANAHIVHQKDEEIRELSRELESARAKNGSLFRRVEVLQQEAIRMTTEHKASLERLEAELLRSRSSGAGTDHRIEEVARRMQQTLEAVRRAAQAEIAEARRDRDAWKEKCEGQEAGGGREAALVAALEAESERLAAARDEVSSLTARNSLEVADLKAKLGHAVRSAQKRQVEQDAENRRLRVELESVRAGGEASARATAATVEGLQSRILGIEGRAKELEMQHEREVADLKSVNKAMEGELEDSRKLCFAVSEQNDTLVAALGRLERELSLAFSERDLAKEEKELASKHQGELQKELCRLDGIIYGGKRGGGSALSASKHSNSSLSMLETGRGGRAERGKLLDVSTRSKRRISAQK